MTAKGAPIMIIKARKPIFKKRCVEFNVILMKSLHYDPIPFSFAHVPLEKRTTLIIGIGPVLSIPLKKNEGLIRSWERNVG